MADDHTIHSQHITRQQARHHLHLPGAANTARPPSYCCVQLSRFTTSQHLQLNFQSVSFCGQQQLPLFMYNIRTCIEEPNQEVLTDDTASDRQTDGRTDEHRANKQEILDWPCAAYCRVILSTRPVGTANMPRWAEMTSPTNRKYTPYRNSAKAGSSYSYGRHAATIW